MNIFDLLIILLLLAFAGIGFMRGIMRESLSLLSWILAVVCGWLFADGAATWFAWLEEQALRKMFGFGVLFVIVFVVASIAGFIFRILFAASLPSLKARIAGASLGVARGAFVVVIMVLLAGLSSVPQKIWWQESLLVGPFQSLSLSVRDLLPDEVAQQFHYD